MPIAIRDSAVLVTGFGRIGKSLSAKLHALGAHVTITTRDPKNFPAIEQLSCTPDETGRYREGLSQYDAIFNTVPAPIFSVEQLKALRPDCFYIELASSPGGISPDALKPRPLHPRPLAFPAEPPRRPPRSLFSAPCATLPIYPNRRSYETSCHRLCHVRLVLHLCSPFSKPSKSSIPSSRYYPDYVRHKYETDSRFGEASSFRERLEAICSHEILHTIPQVEPIGPKPPLDDARHRSLHRKHDCEAHKRHRRHARHPRRQGASSKRNSHCDCRLHQRRARRKRCEYRRAFEPQALLLRPLPAGQSPEKPRSMVADFSKLTDTVCHALQGEQLQPILL